MRFHPILLFKSLLHLNYHIIPLSHYYTILILLYHFYIAWILTPQKNNNNI